MCVQRTVRVECIQVCAVPAVYMGTAHTYGYHTPHSSTKTRTNSFNKGVRIVRIGEPSVTEEHERLEDYARFVEPSPAR